MLLGSGGLPDLEDSTRAERRFTAESLSDASHDTSMRDVLTHPRDPFIVTMAGEYSLEKETLMAVLSLHPEALTSPPGIDVSLKSGLPATTQLFLFAFFADDAYRPPPEQISREQSWSYPNRAPVEDAEAILGERFDGTRHEYGRGFIPSVFAPGFFDLVTTQAAMRFDQGYTAIQFGNIRSPRKSGLDFSVWAQAAFLRHLNDLSDARLEELGIEDPDAFDIRRHLERENLTPQRTGHPAVDPVFREYLLFHHRGVKEFFAALKDWAHASYPDRAPPFHLDQPIGDPRLWECAVAETYVSELVDLVSVEDWRTMPAENFGLRSDMNRNVPEKDIRDFVYKLALATGRNDKPVYGWDTFGGRYYDDVSSDDYFPMLLRLQAAEAYAMGCRRRFALRDAPMSWRARDGQLPAVLREFVDFLWAHQRFLRDSHPVNQVAVIWSLPTLLWNTVPQWGIRATDHTSSFHGTVTLLRESQIPYDVVVFGHPELWPDAENLEDLLTYDAVILPEVECITTAQRTALETVLADGGVLVSCGSPPDRTGTYERQPDGFELFGRAETLVLDADPGKQRLEARSQGGSLIATLNQHGVDSATITPDDTVGINNLVGADGRIQYVHLLNYDYDPEADDFRRKTALEIQLADIDDTFGFARYYSPQTIVDLAVTEREGRRMVTVPELVEWGFIAVARTEAHLEDPGSEQEARDRVSEARDRLAAARDGDQEWSVDLTIADVELRSAETALSYESYSLATESANSAIERVETVSSPTPPPTEPVAQPGFGFGASVLGFGVVSYLVHRWLHTTDDSA